MGVTEEFELEGMPLNLYPNVYSSGSVPIRLATDQRAYPQVSVRSRAVLRELRRLRPGRWQKVIKSGNSGEVHYFERESGAVAGVKFFL